ncbi:phosphoadenosine phosphosulfate reductase family protein, partial [Bradyrhizobium guangdongense]
MRYAAASEVCCRTGLVAMRLGRPFLPQIFPALGWSHRAAKNRDPAPKTRYMLPKHLHRLEAESIEIMRDVVAEFKRPVMLYSIGKDSSVLLHLAIKAFYPAKIPFPLLHVDTTWKFREMISFRDATASRL